LLIIEAAGLEDLQALDIDPEAPLFITGLGLDSIDALEIGLALRRRYGVTFPSDSNDVRRHFESVRSLAAFVASYRKDNG
jgi:acyl carrier protein